jgi:hypothetical protein
VTAGHCVAALLPESFDLVDGTGCPKDRYRTARAGPGAWVSFDYSPALFDPAPEVEKCATCLDIERVILHPDFDSGPLQQNEDVAVVILKQPASLDPIGLPPSDLMGELKRQKKLQSGEFRAVGYGSSFNSTEPPYELVRYFQRRVSEPHRSL